VSSVVFSARGDDLWTSRAVGRVSGRGEVDDQSPGVHVRRGTDRLATVVLRTDPAPASEVRVVRELGPDDLDRDTTTIGTQPGVDHTHPTRTEPACEAIAPHAVRIVRHQGL
jgi:hypothetical protein